MDGIDGMDGGSLRLKCLGLILIWGLIFGEGLQAVEFSKVVIAGSPATVCKVDLAKERLRLFLQNEKGLPFKTFDAIDQSLRPKGHKLLFAMNAGMFHGDFSPVGLFVQEGREIAPINLSKGPVSSNGVTGNFFLKPNGVFFVSAAGAQVLESGEYAKVARDAKIATQSGPLLVQANQIHPAFNPQSKSRLWRNGVGVASAKTVYFVITEGPVSLHEFASYFRDTLRCPNALYLDGDICGLFAPPLKRNDAGNHLGPIIGITDEP